MRKRLINHGIAIIGIAVFALLAIMCVSTPATIRDNYKIPDNKNWGADIAEWTKIINRDPGSFKAYNARGVSYYYNGQYDLAIADFETALRLGDSDARDNLAKAQQAASKQNTSEPSLVQAAPAPVQAIPAQAAQSSEDDFDIRQNAQGTITITGYHGTATRIVIPATIEGVKVTEIAAGVFEYYPRLNRPDNIAITSVIIPDSVTTIGEGAFLNSHLTSLTIPDSVKTIGVRAFSSNQLTSVTISNSITTIANGTFAGNQLTNVTIPDSVTSIGDDAFNGNKLTGVVIPNRVTTIGNDAFNNNQLTSVTIGNRVTTIGFGAFANNQLTGVIIPNSVTTFADHTQVGQDGAFAKNRLTSIIIPNSVTYIGHGTFANNQLTSVTISSSATTFGGGGAYDKVFAGNPITSITLPANLDLKSRQYGKPTNNIDDVFPNNFGTFYESQGKKAGTYTWSGRLWKIE